MAQTGNNAQAKASELTQLLAENIATELLTIWGREGGIECQRAQLMLKQDDGTEKNMGGRNKQNIVTVILKHLNG